MRAAKTLALAAATTVVVGALVVGPTLAMIWYFSSLTD